MNLKTRAQTHSVNTLDSITHASASFFNEKFVKVLQLAEYLSENLAVDVYSLGGDLDTVVSVFGIDDSRSVEVRQWDNHVFLSSVKDPEQCSVFPNVFVSGECLCAQGYSVDYTASQNKTICLPCAKGFYKESALQKYCLKCPNTKNQTDSIASTSLSDCYDVATRKDTKNKKGRNFFFIVLGATIGFFLLFGFGFFLSFSKRKKTVPAQENNKKKIEKNAATDSLFRSLKLQRHRP